MDINETMKALKALPGEMKRITDENRQMSDEIERLNVELGKALASNEEMTDKNKQLEDDLSRERLTTKSLQRNMQSKIDNLENEKQQMAVELEALRSEVRDLSSTDRESPANERKKPKEIIAELESQLADATQKIEDLQRDAELQKKDVAQNHIHVELLEEGVKDFTEETNVDKGHEFFMALNDVLAGHAAWIPSMKRMKAYFKKQRIRQRKESGTQINTKDSTQNFYIK